MSRITRADDRLPAVKRGRAVNIWVNGETTRAYEGETVAAVLLGLGVRAFRRTESGVPRGPFCGMGVCYECLVTVDGVPNVRACQTYVIEGMHIETESPSTEEAR
jgi:sarcosine oxidase subunit alpha